MKITPTPYYQDFLNYYQKAKVLQNQCNLGGKPYVGAVGDDLMEQVHIYDTVERRYAGFSNMLQDLWLAEDNPKFKKQSHFHQGLTMSFSGLREKWTLTTWIYVFLVHRLTGSGASFERDHGYRNTIIPQIARFDNVSDMADYIKIHHGPMFTSIGNQIPAFPKPRGEYKTGGKLYLCEYAPKLAAELVAYISWANTKIGHKVSIRDLVDFMCAFNKRHGINAFHFVFTATAADLADYCPDLVDEGSHMYYGKNAKEAMDLFATKVGKLTKDQFYDEVMEMAKADVQGFPKDIEDVMCDYIRYVENYIPDNREQTYAHLDRTKVWNNSAIVGHPKGRQKRLV
jgi:hypothetical protein